MTDGLVTVAVRNRLSATGSPATTSSQKSAVVTRSAVASGWPRSSVELVQPSFVLTVSRCERWGCGVDRSVSSTVDRGAPSAYGGLVIPPFWQLTPIPSRL